MLLKKLLNVILPATCISCQTRLFDLNSGVCIDCWKELDFIDEPMCNKCGTPFDFAVQDDSLCAECLSEVQCFEKMRNVFVYNDKAKQIILSLKYGDRTDTVKVLSDFMIRAGRDILKEIDVIIPVPLHRKRLFVRKYNQSALLAKTIAKKANKKFIADALIRVKHTKPQGHFSRSIRKNNLKGAFEANAKYDLNNKNILLIDDVITTGATINNCIKAMHKQHKKGCKVYVLGLAKVLLK
ncbi:MAG: ComF family protein [Alphaproteobacteria bacterium]|nr:ComF family protein [Alphaproteobacteria bacterium]